MNRTIISILTLFIATSAMTESSSKEKDLQTFITHHVQIMDPLSFKANLAYWDACITGKPADYELNNQLKIEIRQIYSNKEEFSQLKKWRDEDSIKDPILKRQLEKLYFSYLENQIDPALLKKMVDLDTKIQQDFNIFRGDIDGKKVTNSDITLILTTENDSKIREKAWRASKQVGSVIKDDLINLIKLRNQAAKLVGFENYHTFSITIAEQNVKDLDAIFLTLEKEIREPFARLKKELDEILAARYKITPQEIRPWHYHDPFFQRTPLVYELNFDSYYKKEDVVKLAQTFYEGIGLPVQGILSRSDLYEKENKYPHAYSQDMNRHGDVRILCNTVNDEQWMETMLHELGHALYSENHDPAEPYLLRDAAHIFTTEGIAMFFGRLSRNATWMQTMLHLPEDQRQEIEKVSWKYTQFQQLLFARWAMVMYSFEKELYANPDQDLNPLWWQLVKKYQLVEAPDNPSGTEWASKIHLSSAPCYYHNYMLGELFASQLQNYVSQHVIQSPAEKGFNIIGKKEVGEFLKKTIFAPGAKYPWNDMIQRALGENLTPKYFIEQFVNEKKSSSVSK